jgi:hypothetical protein
MGDGGAYACTVSRCIDYLDDDNNQEKRITRQINRFVLGVRLSLGMGGGGGSGGRRGAVNRNCLADV